MIATHDQGDAVPSAPDQLCLFGEAPQARAAIVEVGSGECPLVLRNPRAFARREHRDEVKTTHTIEGIVRGTWTCRACGNVRGRLGS